MLMRSYEDDLNLEKIQLLKRIKELEEEKKRLEDEPIKATTTYDYVDDIRINSDTGLRENWGKKYGVREVPAWEVRENRYNRIRRIDQQIQELLDKLRPINIELNTIEYNKPENVAKREEQERIRDEEEQKKQLDQERLDHEETYDDVNKLVKYLELAGMYDLAKHVSELRFAYKKRKSDYVIDEIELRSKEKEFEDKTIITKKEYRDIKKRVIRLTKKATAMARKYKELYELYCSAREIVRDIEKKGIDVTDSDTLHKYFNEPTGEYYFRDYGNYFSLKESENLGYDHLKFYRDYDSKYNEDVRKHKI